MESIMNIEEIKNELVGKTFVRFHPDEGRSVFIIVDISLANRIRNDDEIPYDVIIYDIFSNETNTLYFTNMFFPVLIKDKYLSKTNFPRATKGYLLEMI